MNKKLVAAAALSLATLTSQAATLRVPQQHATIQAAVDAAATGDTVLVGPGAYVENVFIQKSLTLRSSRGAARTTIDGSGIGAPVAAAGTYTESVSISGFTLKGGAHLLEPVLETMNAIGAGVFVENVALATVSDNIITGNRGCHGAGIVAYNSNLLIHDNVVRANEPMDWCPGNGITMRLVGHDYEDRDATVERNQVVGNGSLAMQVLVFRNAVVKGNSLTDNGQFIDNAYNGGGLEFANTGGVIANNFIARNQGSGSAGLNVANYQEPVREVRITGNVIVENFSEDPHLLEPTSHVALATFRPSSTWFTSNWVAGDMPGAIVTCAYGGVHVFGNLVINRNPSGTSVACTD